MTRPEPVLPIPVVIDTDAGVDPDDAIALALAGASPEIELLGVTTVDGDVGLRARIAARILGMAGRADVPVVLGLGWPLGPGRGPTMVGFEGRGLLDHPWQGPEATILDRPVPEWLIETSQRIPFQLVAIGPLANVAAACGLDPGFAGRLLGLTIMGGVYQERALPAAWQQSIRERGPVAWPDHNTASDPTAALICAQSGAAITWITSEVTHHLPFRQAGRDHLAEAEELGAALVRLIDVWYAEWFRPTLLDDSPAVPADAVALLHDPLTLASLFPQHVDWLEMRPARLRYDVEDGLFRLHEDAAGDLAMVSTGVAGERFTAFCLERIVRLAG